MARVKHGLRPARRAFILYTEHNRANFQRQYSSG